MRINIKIIIYCLGVALVCLPAAAQENRTWRMAVLSDIHVMAPELLCEDGSAFQDYITHDRKMLKESPALLETVVTTLLSEQPDVVLITGDLTKDGEKVSHEYVAQYLLKPLRKKGIPVYVIPGNHDVNNPHAVSFLNDTVRRVATVSAEDFARCYEDYGYGEAIARDPNSLSYVVKLNNSTRLLAIDACKYDENDYDRNICVTGGRIKPETMAFIRQQVEDAQAHSCKILTMMHHGLVRHWKWQDRVMSDYLVDDWKSQVKSFAQLGLNLVFTGHFHAQDIASQGKGRKVVYDIETGSTVSYPMPYRLVDFDGFRIKVSTRYIREIPGFVPSGGMLDYAHKFAENGITSFVRGMLPEKVPDAVSIEVGKVLGKAYIAHLSGDENMPDSYLSELKSTCKKLRPYSWKYAFALKKLGIYLYEDTAPADNELTIETDYAY